MTRLVWMGLAAGLLTVAISLPVFAAGNVKGKVLTADKRYEGVVVYLEGKGLTRKVPAKPVIVSQKRKRFRPGFVVVVRGTTLEFPNEDRVMHNVFSRTKGNKFDLGFYKRGQSKRVTLKRPGPVDVYCNVHPNMAAVVLVTPSDAYALAAEDGGFELRNVPPGSYQLVAWRPGSAAVKMRVVVKNGETTVANAGVLPVAKKNDHLRKDGSAYGRYK